MGQIDQLKGAIRNLYKSVVELNNAFPERKFTPDGRMVGDMGEAIASLKFHVILDEKSKRDWDGCRINKNHKERKVQVKTTQKNETYLKKPPCDGDLLVFKINNDGGYECCYDGSIMKVWKSLKDKNPDINGAKFIKLSKLKKLN
ncbi:hypothetical protein KKE19_02825 [Patescibacteria group bacterium]|nr:hypothetical protein [Patescibacteria group bacterium]MBU4367849.1 hypothetical protein [Patescibacteria group bacterium]MBU4461696.1 hypothetical protein [Patescibacteria group bacterium]MCG2700317.1 hypothetical protein [Candidatus Parcubacteria bacterium]